MVGFSSLMVLTALAISSSVDAARLNSRNNGDGHANKGNPNTVPAVANVLPSYIAENLGPYSPYMPAGEYPGIPKGCTLTQVSVAWTRRIGSAGQGPQLTRRAPVLSSQVNLLQRHGARFPTAKAGGKIAATLAKLQTATNFSSGLEFARDYRYDLGADSLIPLGAHELFELGITAHARYGHLGSAPFIRSDSSQRVVDSAGNWTVGWAHASGGAPPATAVIISDAAGSDDTLDDSQCDSAPDLGAYEDAWLDIFGATPKARLNAQLTGVELTKSDVLNLMLLCAFSSQYHATLDPFCGLFREHEWPDVEYYYDLDKYYETGHGNPQGAVQGVGYANELLARLTNNRTYATDDQTQVNQTLAASSTAFPLGRAFYADFSHDSEIVAILTALGLKQDTTPLGILGPNPDQVWVTSQIVPFGGNVVTERMTCSRKEYIRILINDQLQKPKACGADRNGLCALDRFVASQAYATDNSKHAADWAACSA